MFSCSFREATFLVEVTCLLTLKNVEPFEALIIAKHFASIFPASDRLGIMSEEALVLELRAFRR